MSSRTLAPGSMLGPYRVEAFLGEGGMGRVYRAHDTTLDREVALKVVGSEEVDGELRLRFLAEARSAAALNHPNICTIYQVGEADGVDFIAMELVHGEPLSARVKLGPMAPKEVARIGAALASALETAHAKGILHRDLKPDNVFLTAGDAPKLLDFGLAKRIFTEGADQRTAPQPLTIDGRLRGTLAYMSPEQATLAPMDGRSDIFSLGIVLFEMTAGMRPFVDDSPTNELIRIVRDEPFPLDSLAPSNPPELTLAIYKCLEKEKSERYQHAADLAVDLRRIERSLHRTATQSSVRSRATAVTTATPRVRLGPRPVSALLALGMLAAGAAAGFLADRYLTRRPEAMPPSSPVLMPLTSDAAVSESPAFSPDGETVAYASDRSGNFEIYLRRTSGGRELNVTSNPADDVQPAVSPDGRLIAFVSTRSSRRPLTRINPDQEPTGGDVWVVPPLGGEARLIARDAGFPTFSADSRTLYYVAGEERRNEVRRVPVEGGTPAVVLSQKQHAGEYRRLSLSPDGRWLLLGVAYQGIFLARTDGSRVLRLDDGARPTFAAGAPAGQARVVWSRPDLNLWSRDLDLQSGAWASPPERITVGRGWDTDAAVDPSGRRVAFTTSSVVAQIVGAPLDPVTHRLTAPFQVLLQGDAYDMDPQLSPDGNELVFVSVGRWPGPQRAFRSSLAEGTLAPFTEQPGVSESNPLFSPDGKWIAFERDTGNGRGKMLVMPREGGEPRAVATGAEKSVAVWLPDSRHVIFQASGQGKAAFQLASLDGGPPRTVLQEPYDTMHPAVSPDGKWLAFAGNRDGTFDIFLKPVGGGEAVKVAATDGRDGHPFFSNDSRVLFFQPGHQNILWIPVNGGEPRPVTEESTHSLYLEAPHLTPDGKSLLLSRVTYRANISVLELGPTLH